MNAHATSSNLSGKRWSRQILSLAAALAIFQGYPASAATVNWTGGSGNWSLNTNWTTPPSAHNVPGSGDAVSIAPSDGVSRTITYDYSGAAVTLGSLTIDLTGGSGSTTTLSMAANNLSAGSETFGNAGSGTFNQSGGTNTDNGTFRLAIGAGATGTYALSGSGAVVANNSEGVGFGGTGTLNQTGGTNTIAAGTLNIGVNSGSNGGYNLSGGSASVTIGSVFVGGDANAAGGTGNLTVSGTGILTTTSTASINVYNATGNGLTLNGGTINTGSLNLSGNPGLFNWTAGTLHLTSTSANFIVDNSGGTLGGTLNLVDGQTLTVASSEIVGDTGTGSVNQTGGTHTVSTWLYLGYTSAFSFDFGGNGTYTLAGGTLNSPATSVGYQAAGAFTQTGGTFNSTSFITVGDQSGGNGTFNLNGGTLNGAALNVGYSSGLSVGIFSLPASTGTFNQTAGTATFTDLVLGQNSGASGFYNLGAGSLTVSSAGGTETIGNVGTGEFIQNGGTNSLTSGAVLFIAAAGGSTGDYSINGGTLAIAGNVYIGGTNSGAGGTGTLEISGSAVVNISGGGTLKIWNTPGTLVSFTGGSLTAGAIDVSGNTQLLNWNAGTLALTATNLVFDPTIAGAVNSPFSANTTLNSSQVLQVSGGTETIGGGGSASLTLNSSTNTVSGNLTIQTSGTLTLNGTSTLTVGGGTGSVVNLGLLVFNSGKFNARLVNQGETSFPTNFVAGDGIENQSNISLISTQLITASGAGFSNDGTLTLNGGIVTGATFANNSDGIIIGPGTITAPFTNSGLLNVPNGTTRVGTFTNSGVITISGFGAELGPGGTVTNNATIQGFGEISDVVVNHATIRPIGGTLAFTGALTNAASGLISIPASGEVLMQGSSNFPTNAGLISLAGGTFDNGGQTLNNTGQIAGYGVLSTGGLTNNGSFTLTGGTSTINGNVTNSASQTINIKYQPAIFTGNITNNGTIIVTGTTVTFTGTYTGNAYISDPAANIFQNDVTIIPGGSMTGGAGDQYEFTGGSVTNNGTFSNGGALQSLVNVTNTGTFTQSGPQSWSAGTTFTNAAGTANFLSDAGSSNGLNLAISVLSGNVNFTGPEHLQGLSVTGGTAAFTGSALVSGRGNRNPNAAVGVVGSLTIAGGATPTGTVNLNNNALIISNGGAPGLNAVETDIAYARDGGKWDKPGITSSTAQSAYAATGFDSMTLGDALNSSLPTPYTTFGGQSVSPNDVLIAFTYGGDANLDGTINGNDYFQIDRGFLDHYTGWVNGDFNYDGTVNGNDYFIIDSNFIDQSGQLAAPEVLAHAAEFGPSYLSQFTPGQLAEIGVPEPASLALLGLGVIGLLARRRTV